MAFMSPDVTPLFSSIVYWVWHYYYYLIRSNLKKVLRAASLQTLSWSPHKEGVSSLKLTTSGLPNIDQYSSTFCWSCVVGSSSLFRPFSVPVFPSRRVSWILMWLAAAALSGETSPPLHNMGAPERRICPFILRPHPFWISVAQTEAN